MFSECIVNFYMTWNRLLLAVHWIDVDIMARPAAMQDAATIRELSDQLASFHTAISFI